MIEVTRLGGEVMVVNAELIETVESHPDTVITLTTGKKLIVREKPQEVARRVVEYRRNVLSVRHRPPEGGAGGSPAGEAGR